MTADWTNALQRARDHSPFLALAMQRFPDITDMLARGQADEALAEVLATEHEDLGVSLRRERVGLALVLGVGDLAGR